MVLYISYVHAYLRMGYGELKASQYFWHRSRAPADQSVAFISSAHAQNQIRKRGSQDQSSASRVSPRRAETECAVLASSRASLSFAFGSKNREPDLNHVLMSVASRAC